MVAPADGPASAQTMLSFGTWRSGYCLEAVWAAYKANGAVGNGSYPTAYSAWCASNTQHHGDMNPPLGVPCYFYPPGFPPGYAGDVVISWGNGLCVATDYSGHIGQIGVMSLADRARQIGDNYLGWCEDICGAPVVWAEPPPADDDEKEGREVALRMMHWEGGTVSLTPGDTTKKLRRANWDSVSGFFSEWTESGATYANNMARNWQTGSSAEVTQSLARAIYNDCVKVRATGSK